MRYPDGLREEAKLAIKQHWKLVLGSSGHLKWFGPDGTLRLTTSMTPSKGRRGILNAKAQLKRQGIVVA